MNCLVEIYRHVGERVRMDLGKKGLPQSRCVTLLFNKPFFFSFNFTVTAIINVFYSYNKKLV